jgi:hypothetical protein
MHPQDDRTIRTRAPSQSAWLLFALGLTVAIVASACTDSGSGAPASRATNSRAGTGNFSANPTLIQQPPLGRWKKLARGQLAPMSERVDLEMPSFSDPTSITNPLFPISDLHSALALGHVEGEQLKVETTLLPETKIVEWNGQRVETLQSQFLAYHDGRIDEVAVDTYAQADDGAVWYFGEDVFIYKDGRVVDTLGTWLAGVDGPASMIMPADPQVGDAYRTENVPGLVFFEESKVKRIGVTVKGPTGPVDGAMIGQELHFPGEVENKTFAPGYGEFFSGVGGNVEVTALAVPTDALPGPAPAELETIASGADEIFADAQSGDWSATSVTFRSISVAWKQLRAGKVPTRLDGQMNRALKALDRAVAARDRSRVGHAALDVAGAGLDLELQYRPPVEIDMARFDLWTRRLLLDAAARNAAGVLGDITTLEWIRDRLVLDTSDESRIDDQLRYLRAAAEAEEFRVVEEDTARLREAFAAAESTA